MSYSEHNYISRYLTPSIKLTRGQIKVALAQMVVNVRRLEAELGWVFKVLRHLDEVLAGAYVEFRSMEQYFIQEKATLKREGQYAWAKKMVAVCDAKLSEYTHRLAQLSWQLKEAVQDLISLKAQIRAVCQDKHFILPKDF